jgi:hypothetical protein
MGGKIVHALRGVGAISALLAVLAAVPAVAGAATITVTTANDVSASQCTLRDAIIASNTNAANNACPAGEPDPVTDVIQFSLPGPSTITLGSALPVVFDQTAIVGPGEAQLTISGPGAFTILDFSGTAIASLSGVTITGGGGPEGAGIINEGALALDRVAVVGNVASEVGGPSAFPEGGGIRNGGGALTLSRSTVSGNSAIGSGAPGQNGPEGGGIYNNTGTLTIEESTISGNSAKAVAGVGGTTNAVGGGIENASGKLTLRRSTVSGNAVRASGSPSFNTAQGAGVFNGNAPTTTEVIEDSTITGNSATAIGSGANNQSQGGGVYSQGLAASPATIASSTIVGNGAVLGANLRNAKVPTVSNTIIADPLGGGQNCDAPVQSAGFNLEDANSCGFTKPTDRPKTDPLLSPAGLADNGGPTPTIALQLGSPAVNQGLSAPGEAIDQRGTTRPLLYPGIPVVTPGSNGADIGAYELQVPVPPAAPGSAAGVEPPAPTPVRGRPRVRVSCPKSAKPGGCRFTLQVFSAKPHKHSAKSKRARAKKPVAESAVAKVKVGAGKSALITLKPKERFAAKLEAAAKLLMRETVTVKGATVISFRRLRVVGR